MLNVTHQRMKIKTTRGYHYTPIRMAKPEKMDHTKYRQEWDGARTFMPC